jgi:UDP-GlcNAc:undecaprenyl-phosphate/decaprenyl-phosphate GlcNAc-1-phosphate transferase
VKEGLIAAAITAALTPVVMRVLRRWHVFDVASNRSSHDGVRLRGLGLAVALGGLGGLAWAPHISGTNRATLLCAVVGFGAIGLVDDVRSSGAFQRLAAQVVVGAAAAYLLYRHAANPTRTVVVAAAATFWIVAFVNCFNFMDGIDGISVAEATLAGGAWLVAGHAYHAGLLVDGAAIGIGFSLGFAPFNFPSARGFMGDVGSYFVGAWLATLILFGLRAGVPVEAMLGPVAISIADTSTTLARRIRRGDSWWDAHREHVYQRVVTAGSSHARTTGIVGAFIAATSLLFVGAPLAGGVWRVILDAAAVVVVIAYLVLPRLGTVSSFQGA